MSRIVELSQQMADAVDSINRVAFELDALYAAARYMTTKSGTTHRVQYDGQWPYIKTKCGMTHASTDVLHENRDRMQGKLCTRCFPGGGEG